MQSFNGALIILTLWCNSQVHTARISKSTKYEFPDRRLIIGKNHIHKKSLVCAMCMNTADNRIADCRIILDGDAFGDQQSVEHCDVDLATKELDGELDIIGIDLLGKERAIFIWIDRNLKNLRHAQIMMQIIHMRDCTSIMRTFTIDNRLDMKTQVFIMPHQKSYDIVFANNFLCRDYFCKITINEDGAATQPIQMIPNSVLVHALEQVEKHSGTILVTVADTPEYIGRAKYYLLLEQRRIELGRILNITNLGWSTSNGFISFCSNIDCSLFDLNGKLIKKKQLSMTNKPIMYAALHNLPDQKHIALICDGQPNSNYRIIKIGSEGEQEHSINLPELKCSPSYKYMTAQFYRKNSRVYCLSLFHSLHDNSEITKFVLYCFLISNLSYPQ